MKAKVVRQRLAELFRAMRIGRTPPFSVQLAALLYFAIGIHGVIDSVLRLKSDERAVYQLDAMGLILALGVYRLRPGWRATALVFSIIEVIRHSCYLARNLALLNADAFRFSNEVTEDVFYFFLWWQLLSIIALTMAFFLLGSHHARSFFVSHRKASREFGIPLLVLTSAIYVCRETGSVEANAFVASAQHESNVLRGEGNQRAIDGIWHCAIEFRGNENITWYASLAWQVPPPLSRKELTSPPTPKRLQFRWPGATAPSEFSKSPNRFVVQVEQIELHGLYWLPLWKSCTGVVKFSVRGRGQFQDWSIHGSRSEKLEVVGPCTMIKLRERLAKDAERLAVQEIVSSATRSTSPAQLKRIQRTRTLRFGEAHKLAADEAMRGTEYLQNGNPRDAQRAFRHAINTLDSFRASFFAAPKIRLTPKESRGSVARQDALFLPVHTWYVAEMYRYQAVQWETHGKRVEALRAYAKAIAGFREAMILDPLEIEPPLEEGQDLRWTHLEYFKWSRIEAHLARARLYAWEGNDRLAMSDIKAALEVSPDNPTVLGERAWLYATATDAAIRDGRQAITDALGACESTNWGDDNHLDTLAAAYAANGDFEQATKWEATAIELLERENDTKLRGDAAPQYPDSNPKAHANRLSSVKTRRSKRFKATGLIMRITDAPPSRIEGADSRQLRLDDYRKRAALYNSGQSFFWPPGSKNPAE